jgi:multimeric flavodoxin WrbA
MAMKVLGICGSHRKESTTKAFLQKALVACEKEGIETELIELSGRKIGNCVVCDLCKTKFECSQKDDMQALCKKLETADAIIIASPTYFGMVSGKVKSMFDRSLPLRRNGMRLSGKIGGAIAVGASRNGGQELVCHQIQNWMLLHEMVVVSDKETAHFGGIGWVPRGSKPEDDRIGMETCGNLGRKIAEVLRKSS